MNKDKEQLRIELASLIGEVFSDKKRKVEVMRISEPTYGAEETVAVLDSLLEGWLGINWRAASLEKAIADYIQVAGSRLVNSGSSASLLAISALRQHYELSDQDEIITSALTFPTTVSAILLNRLTPVLVDSSPTTYLIDQRELDNALSNRTKGIYVVHSIGNIVNMHEILNFARQHNLFVLEDACDAMGGTFAGKKVGGFGDIGTFSFYPAHQMTTGEGGAITFNNSQIGNLIQSLRDWGRITTDIGNIEQSSQQDQWRKRFADSEDPFLDWYDKKFVYTNVGFNCKIAEFQAAIGLVQLSQLDGFVKARQLNFDYLRNGLSSQSKYFVMPEAHPLASPSWLFFPLSIRKDAPFSRKSLICFLEDRQIETRPVLAGNIMRQPGYRHAPIKVIGNLENSDSVMQRSICLGLHPKLTRANLDYAIDSITKFCNQY